eukprot:TRINITY_DN9234_c0_g1_i1.p1 TRINITY_DN9234_c0_g1~~TRINITY_DN9234_c0_g1_i1.p1  ORF type:complete len:411 (+),score=83.48 TRINITY_DN9234_c0_g1_i1:123-1355(+)
MQHPNWPKHKKHVFIFSSAGKPIYSRYGDESTLAGFTGVLQVMISFIRDNEHDNLRAMIAGKHKIVFLVKGPIYLVCISKTNEPVELLLKQLEYMHSQVLYVLTASGVNKIFDSRAQADIRPLLSGTEKFLDSLMSWMDHDFSTTLDGIHCLRLSNQNRNLIGHIMHTARPDDLLYAILIAKTQLVNLVRPKKHNLYPSDLHLIINFVSTSTSFRSSQTWTPLCLPRFSSAGFLHAYVSYLTDDVCLLLVSSKIDSFYKLNQCKNTIAKSFENGVFSAIEKAIENQHYDVSEVGISNLLHFVYKSTQISQITAPKFGPPYTTRKEKKRLFRLYQHSYIRVTQSNGRKPHKIYVHSSQKEIVLAWVTSGFQLYATFGPLEPLSNVIRGCNKILRWIQSEETEIFVLDSPVF